MAEGVTHISLPTQEYDRGRQEKTNRRTNTNKLGVNQEQRKVCNTTCMCIPDSRYGLTLAWVTSENSTMLLESDILRLFFTGPYLVSSPLCSGVWCWLPLRGSTPTSLFASLLSSLNCPPWSPAATALSALQPPTLSWVASSTLIRVPLPLPDTARFQVQESFVWFRAKTDSSALAAYPHSATLFCVFFFSLLLFLLFCSPLCLLLCLLFVLLCVFFCVFFLSSFVSSFVSSFCPPLCLLLCLLFVLLCVFFCFFFFVLFCVLFYHRQKAG